MSSNNHNDEVFQNKKKPKTPFKFNLILNEEQKEAKQKILEHPITLLTGNPGSGKTLLSTNIALDLLFKKEIERIYIARPFIYAESEQSLGALPGGIQDKLIGITTPILENMYLLCGKQKVEELVQEGIINILPLAFMRGITIFNSVLILDEVQNATSSQLFTALSRLGKNSKAIITGDINQCDLKNKSLSCWNFLKILEKDIQEMTRINLTSNHRHDIVEKITNVYNQYKD